MNGTPKGEELILDRNMFVERVLPASVLRTLDPEEMEEYRRPFTECDARRPTLDWPRQLPVDGAPEAIVDLVNTYAAWMAATSTPKLFINADPGSLLTGDQRAFCRTWPHQDEITVSGLHFLQEDSGPEIGQAVTAWLEAMRR